MLLLLPLPDERHPRVASAIPINLIIKGPYFRLPLFPGGNFRLI